MERDDLDNNSNRKDADIHKCKAHVTEPNTPLTMDQVLNKIGHFGLYQVILLAFFIYAVTCWGGLVYALAIYLLAEPRWECINNSTVCNITGSVGPGDGNYEYRCGIPREDWKFLDENSSLVTQFDLVCDKATYPPLAFLILQLGEITGAFFIGFLCDIFGRKRLFFASGLLICCLLLVLIFTQNILMFLILIYLIGIGYCCIPVTSHIHAIEYAGLKYRSKMGNTLWVSYGFSFLLIALIGYLQRYWKMVCVIVLCLNISVLAGYWLVPESFRWLIVKKRFKEAVKIIKTIAKINKKPVIEDDTQIQPINEEECKVKLGDVRLMFRSGYAKTTLVVWLSWFANGVMYNGVNLSAPNVGGSAYFNWFLTGISEAVSAIICVYVHDRMGRKLCVIVFKILAAFSALGAMLFTLYDDGSTGFLAGKILMSMVLAKIFISISFNGIIMLTAELYPTVVRGVAEGTSSVFIRLGGIASVYIIYLIRVHPLLPYGIMGIIMFISAFSCLILRETKTKPTIDVFELPLEKKPSQPQGQC